MNRRSFRVAASLLESFGLALILVLLVLSVGGSSQEQAATGIIYVAPGASCNGATPCYADIQSAVNAASPGDEIRVAAGVYTGVRNIPSLNTAYFTATQLVAVTKTLTLRGGYTVTNWSTPDPTANPTILDAQNQGRVLIAIGNINLTIAGFHLVNGNSGGLGGLFSAWTGKTLSVGGGVYVVSAAVTISNCEISNNVAPPSPVYYLPNLGGGMFAMNSEIHLLDSIVSGNKGDCTGGVYLGGGNNSRVIGNVFQNNWGTSGNCYDGGGLYAQGSNILVEKNLFIGNYAYGGGALGIEGDVTVLDNVIQNNSSIYGGGIHINEGRPLVKGNVISGNEAMQGGGGISIFQCYPAACEPLLINNVIAENNVSWGGGWGSGIFVGEGNPTLVHTTVARNTGGDSGVWVWPFTGKITLTMINSILVNHTVGISVTSGTLIVDGILWHNTPVTVFQGAGSVVTIQHPYTGDPMFAADGYHLSSSFSAAVDKGIESGVVSDIDGDARSFGSAPDLGADEWATVETVAGPLESTIISATANGFTTTVLIPSGAISESTDFRYVARALPDSAAPPGFTFAGQAFNLDALRDGYPIVDFAFDKPVTVTVVYKEGALRAAIEDTLLLMRWNGSIWEDAACGSYSRYPGDNRLEVPVCHLSNFALFGETNWVYLPLVLRNY